MAKIHALTSKDVIKILKKHGFKLIRTKGSHQIFRNEESAKMTIVPFHSKDLPKGTLSKY